MSVDRCLVRNESLSANHYQERPPSPDLRGIVACVWVRVVRLGGSSGLSPVIPDGCADIMAYDVAPPCVAGPDATTRWTRLTEGTVITGIRLRPGAVRMILGCEAASILNGGVLLSDLAPGAGRLHHELLAAGTLHDRQSGLEAWVRVACSRHRADDRRVIAACTQLTADPSLNIDRLARRFGWSSRTIHRRFVGACGYGPKHFQRIMRIQRAIRCAYGQPTPRLSEIAYAAGFADQSHMTRDFRDITGFTPVGYLAGARPELGAWIEEDW